MASYFYLFKYIVVGDTAVGKSCIVLQFIEKKPRKVHDITVGVEFGSSMLKVDNKNIKLQIWDTAGQENFLSITRSYYHSAAGAFLVYDVTKRETFNHLTKWLHEITENSSPNLSIILIGNKIDQIHLRQVTTEEGQQFAKENGLFFIETSALKGINVNEAFNSITETIYNKIQSKSIVIDKSESQGIKYGMEAIEEIPNDHPLKNHYLIKQKDSKKTCC